MTHVERWIGKCPTYERSNPAQHPDMLLDNLQLHQDVFPFA